MALSNMTCQAAKPKIESYKIADGEGLYLEVTPIGTKFWRLKYRLHGKGKRISIGAQPFQLQIPAKPKKRSKKR